jgi:hypothetical protein
VDKVMGGRRKVTTAVIILIHQVLLGWKIKEDQMCEACNPRKGKIGNAKLYSEVLNTKSTQETYNTSFTFFFLWRYSPNLGLGLPPWNSPVHFGFLDLRQSVGLLGRVISSSQGLYPYTNTEKRTHIHKQ